MRMLVCGVKLNAVKRFSFEDASKYEPFWR